MEIEPEEAPELIDFSQEELEEMSVEGENENGFSQSIVSETEKRGA